MKASMASPAADAEQDNSRTDSNASSSPGHDVLELGVKQRNRFDYFSSSTQGAQGSQMKIESEVDLRGGSGEGHGAKYRKNN